MCRLFFLLLLFIAAAPLTRAQAPPELPPAVRGVWITNVDSDVLFSKAKIAEAMDYLAGRGFNVVFPVVWNKGYTLYPSSVMDSLFGKPQDPVFEGRDPLAELIVEAHRNGLEVIPWFEFGFSTSYSQNGGHILAAKPDWAAIDQDGKLVVKNGFDWMNALHPEVQDFMLRLLREVVTRYDVDGVQGDDRLPAMPGEAGYSAYTRGLYAAEHDGADPPASYNDAGFMAWKAGKITAFAGHLYRMIKAHDPNLIVSMAPTPYPWGYQNYLQDTPAWLDSGYVDLIHPQLYRYDVGSYKQMIHQTIGPFPGSSDGYIQPQHRRRFFPGILVKAGNRYNGPDYVLEALRYNRTFDVEGEVFFFYEGMRDKNQNLADTLYASLYHEPARVPGREDVRRPLPAIVHEDGASTTRFGVWQTDAFHPGFEGSSLETSGPGAGIVSTLPVFYTGTYDAFAYVPSFLSNATREARYTLYNAADSVVTVVDQNDVHAEGWTSIGTLTFEAGRPATVRLDAGQDGRATYADAVMVMLNRARSPEVVIPTAVDHAPPDLGADLPAAFVVYPNPFTTAATLSFTLSTTDTVRLTVFDVLGREVATLMDGLYAPQQYRVVWEPAGRANGLYIARLHIGVRSRTVLMALRK